MRKCSLKWVPSSMVEVSDLWCCEAHSLRNNLPVLSTCKGSIFLRVYQVSVIRPFGMFENTRKTFINHEQGREKLNPNILDSSASVVRTPTRCASLSTDVALRTLWPTQLKTALKRSIAKQRHKHRTKREKDKRTHFILMYHLQPYAVKGINLKIFKILDLLCEFQWVLSRHPCRSDSSLEERQICKKCGS